jgi:hypothetical protein
MIAGLPAKLFWSAKRLLTSLFVNRCYVVFCGPVPEPDKSSKFSMVEHVEFSPRVIQLYQQDNRLDSDVEFQLRNRFKNRFRLYEFCESGNLVGYFWLHAGGIRFIDEVAYFMEFPEGYACTRDFFVLPEHRGRKMFQNMVGYCIRTTLPDINTVCTVSYSHNESSVRAHRNAGFDPVTIIRHVHVFNLLLYRTIPESNVAEWSGYQYPRRLVFTGPKFRKFVRQNLN